MTSALKRSCPFGSRPSSLVEEANHQFKVPQVPIHKKMSMASPSINVSTENASTMSSSLSCMSPSMSSSMSSSLSSRRLNNNKTSARQDTSTSSIVVPENNNSVTSINGEKSPLPSPPSSKGRRNMKNLQLVVPPVRSAISAPSSPQLPQISSAHTHNRRPSTPICIFQNKGHDVSNNVADPMALMSKTENAIGEDLPYKDEPIKILPNLYLGSELNAANRTMLNRLNIEFILNVAKEVENPYLDEIVKQNSPNYDNQSSPNYSDCSDDSFKTAIQSPMVTFNNIESPMAPPSPFGNGFNNIQKRSSIPRPASTSLQFAKCAMQSGVPLIIPPTSEYNSLKYKKFFWTHNQENLISDFSTAFSFINEARSANRNILVHCQCGVSRSASLIIGYVMEANRMTLNQAYEFVKDRSPYISPNMSLVYQLVDFEKTLKLGPKNHINMNNALPGTPTKATNRPTHSRSSSIESDLLLKTHRRSSSIPRNNPVLNVVPVPVHNLSESSPSPKTPKTPTVNNEGSAANLSQQSTVKGGTGRFHVITASTAPVSPSTLSPVSSISPTSTASPTTPLSESSSPTTRSGRFLRPQILSSKTSQSSLTIPVATTSTRSQSQETTDMKTPTNSMSSNVIIPNNSNNSSTTSFSSFYSKAPLSPRIPNQHHNHIGNDVISSGSGPPTGIFSKSTLDSIFSPTRTSPPITPVVIPNIFLDDE